MKSQGIKIIANNKKAYHDYFVEEKIECGISLIGTEVKSLRLGKVNLKDSYCSFYQNELYVRGMHISPYEKGNIFNKDPLRERKLLLHKRELNNLFGKVLADSYTLVPLKLYFSGRLVKLEIGLCKGKKLHDKRAAIAEKTVKRDIARAMKEFNR